MRTLKIEVIDVSINNTAVDEQKIRVMFQLTIDKESLPESTEARFCKRPLSKGWGYHNDDDTRYLRETHTTGELDNLDRFIEGQVEEIRQQFVDAMMIIDEEQATINNVIGSSYYVTVKSRG